MLHDLDFLDGVAEIRDMFDFSLVRNPLLVEYPNNARRPRTAHDCLLNVVAPANEEAHQPALLGFEMAALGFDEGDLQAAVQFFCAVVARRKRQRLLEVDYASPPLVDLVEERSWKDDSGRGGDGNVDGDSDGNGGSRRAARTTSLSFRAGPETVVQRVPAAGAKPIHGQHRRQRRAGKKKGGRARGSGSSLPLSLIHI